MKSIKVFCVSIFCFLFGLQIAQSQSYDSLWLRYAPMEDKSLLKDYQQRFEKVQMVGVNNHLKAAIREEWKKGLRDILKLNDVITDAINVPLSKTGFIAGTSKSALLRGLIPHTAHLGDEGYMMQHIKNDSTDVMVLLANNEQGLLYGTFDLLKQMRLQTPIAQLEKTEVPRNPIRMVNHWDDPAGHVERGYAGNSIFHWDDMSQLTARDTMYVRLLASIGMNASSINNVNTKTNRCIGWKLLYSDRIDNLVPFAQLLHNYGISMYLSVNFAAPVLIGEMETADPLDPKVMAWWEAKTAELFEKLPGFGGLLVKADSEGEPGPITYGRNHAEGANMLADAVAPYDGLVIWRAFVYEIPGLSEDRTRNAYQNFNRFDGQFRDNVIIQSKNGSVDFQVREPVAPLFGGLPNTNMTLELQVTQEYTGQSTHLNFLVPQWKEVLDFDTHATGQGATVADVIAGEVFPYQHSGMAAVWNFGDDPNWTGHYLAQANTFGYGRLAWNPSLTSEAIAEEWIKLTYGHDDALVKKLSDMLLTSWETFEAYTSPLGSGMLSDIHHFDPDMVRRHYVLNADDKVLGSNRTASGSDYVGDYHEPITSTYENLETIPDELLLFFHRVPYTHTLQSGKTVIQHIYDAHYDGVQKVEEYVEEWKSHKGKIDDTRYKHTLQKLEEQLAHAKVWRDHINGYFYYKSKIEDDKNRLDKKVKSMFPMKGTENKGKSKH